MMKILLVEDDEINRFILKKLLEKNHFQVITAINGREALEILQSDISFDIILTDILMPEMSGIELLEAVKAHAIFRSMPIIGFSQGNLEHMKAKTNQRFDALFPKPLNIEKIISTVKLLIM